MSEEKALVPAEQREIDFYGDVISAVLVHNEEGREAIYVPMRPICEFLGVSWSGQLRRINRDLVLSQEVKRVNVTFTDSRHETMIREVICLPLDLLNGFLFGLNPLRAKEEVRDRLVLYQRECYRVLAEAFLSPMYSTVSPDYDDPGSQVLMQLHNMAKVIAATTREMMEVRQIAMSNKTRLDAAREYLRGMNQRLAGMDERLTAVERRTPKLGNTLSEEQQFEIQDRIKRIALVMAQYDPGKSHFRAVYDALSLQTRRNSFKDIPQSSYEATIEFLDEWLERVRQETGND
ncbi:MAG: hypothetical protein KF770_18155 [Anaerolineae bacterium]|nr:hypothetical protein [Anaerolineae bacterium]